MVIGEPFTLEDVRVAFPEWDVEREIDRGTSKVCYRVSAPDGGDVAYALLIALKSGPTGSTEVSEAPDADGERLRREILAMQLVDSDRVVKVLEGPDEREVGGAAHVWFVEPCYDSTLCDRIAEDWSRNDVVRLITCLLEGVDALWSQQHLVHRDIKPANIAIDETGDVLLLDLSAAYSKDWTTLTKPYEVAPRTFFYAAPEQLQPRRLAPELDFRTDLFSVGIVAFEAWTGRHPYLTVSPSVAGSVSVDPGAYMKMMTAGAAMWTPKDEHLAEDPLMRYVHRLFAPERNVRFRTMQLAMEGLGEVS